MSNNFKETHLTFIQNIIARLNSNSFLIKGWCITIVSALLAVSATAKNEMIAYIGVIPILIFWGLDTKYLQNEKKFIILYGLVVQHDSTIKELEINIRTDKISSIREARFINVIAEPTVLFFYSTILLLTILGTSFLKRNFRHPVAESLVTSKVEELNLQAISERKALLEALTSVKRDCCCERPGRLINADNKHSSENQTESKHKPTN